VSEPPTQSLWAPTGRTQQRAETPRAVALRIVRRVTEHGGYSTLATSGALARSGLPKRDRELAAELTYGTLRRMLCLDWALEPRIPRHLSSTPPNALACLRLGAYQLLFTRIPAHAAVGETVKLANGRERGFVNAVLRRLAGEQIVWPSDGSDESISIRTGLSLWGVRELRRVIGGDPEPAASALAGRAKLALRVNTCRMSVEKVETALRDQGVNSERHPLHPETLQLSGGFPRELPGFDEGWFTVQDASSAFVVRALQAAPGDRVLDACAAPGGKATHLACIVSPSGVLVAADVRERRAALVAAVAGRLGTPVSLVVQDARHPAVRGPFDRVLVDPPCSGIGAARRRPELLWRPRRSDLSRLARLQVQIAAAAADLLRPGGRLVYSVCTFPRAETDAAADALLRRCPELEPAEIQSPSGPASRIRLWPHEHATDGMFVAAFRRRGPGHG
jgi:16S rRNA (cytosine967-C5)-methyltransferase